ncbi:hypothetical protein MTR67_041764 [Solanum verrucosum]|uniref:Uncharacterized protein n=1 Tax=Solanum verrucosum TaxID=315347 RepID=A0AAF0ZTH8_SOLVR|nr:hypothetical protein MTR67_041764 [Solanum verrucosum]
MRLGISVSVNDNQLTAEVNDPESPKSATIQPVSDKCLGSKLDRPVDLQVDASAVKSEILGAASVQEMNAAESIEAKKMQMASVEVSQSVVSDTDYKTSNNESYESKPQEAEGEFSVVESKLLEAEDQATENVPNKEELQHNERENPDSTELKLAFSEDKEHEQHDKAEQDKQRISTELSPNAPTLELKAVSTNEIDVGRQMELSDSSKAEEGMEVVHVVSLAKDLPASDNPELLKEVTQSFVGTGRSDGSISSVALDVSGDQVSEEKVAVSAEGITDSSGLSSNPNTFECGVSSILNSNSLQEPEDTSKNSLSDDKQSTGVDDPVIERTGVDDPPISCLSEAIQTTVTLGGSDHGEHEKVGTECPIGAGGETEKERTEEKLAGVSEGDICPVGGHNDLAIVTDTTVHESRKEIFHEASEDASISNDAKALESASATGLDSKVISDCDVKERTDLNSCVVDTDLNSRVGDTDLNNSVGDTDLNNRVVVNSPAGDVLKSATGVISSASQNEGYDKLIKQNETVSAVDTPISSSSRADSLDANWGSISGIITFVSSF